MVVTKYFPSKQNDVSSGVEAFRPIYAYSKLVSGKRSAYMIGMRVPGSELAWLSGPGKTSGIGRDMVEIK